MDLRKELKGYRPEELTEIVVEQINQHLVQNKNEFENYFSEEIRILDRITVQHRLLATCIRESNEDDKFSGRFFFGKHYLTSISANFYALRDLYSKGLHVPFQILLRSQIELVNTYIAFIGDDDFFIRYCRGSKQNPDKVLTPKPSHSEKALQRIMKEHNNEGFKEFWSLFGEMMNYFYTDLSEAAHGNVPRIVIHSFEETSAEEVLYPPLLGVSRPLYALENILHRCLSYFQITYKLMWLQLEKQNMLDLENPFIDFVAHYSDKFELVIKNRNPA